MCIRDSAQRAGDWIGGVLLYAHHLNQRRLPDTGRLAGRLSRSRLGTPARAGCFNTFASTRCNDPKP
eukprot:7424966-Pyramimonas_sp.AAC.1